MSCALTNRGARRRARGGFTLLEMLVALAVAATFLSGVYAVVTQILKAQNEAEGHAEAARNGRAALSRISEELESMVTSDSDLLLVVDRSGRASFGDKIDNDGDGQIDEEIVDGKDDDGDYSDRHATLGATSDTLKERPGKMNKADLGDAGVDEDARFGHDKVTFNLSVETTGSVVTKKTVSYYIATYDNQPNVLVREILVTDDGTTNTSLSNTTPLAFGVVGFDVLGWDPNATNANQDWVATGWDSSALVDPALRLPASIYVRLTVAAKPLETEYQGEAPLQTLTMETMVNLEAITSNSHYPRPTL